MLFGVRVQLPWWVSVLKAASEWGTPPWELAGDEDTLLWLKRWQYYNETVAKALEKKGSVAVNG